MDKDKTCSSCSSAACSARERREGETDEQFQERQALAERLCRIRHKVLVLSGKGGVGKSTVAANLAVSLALRGFRVGLLDIDIHGPSIPKLLRLEDRRLEGDGRSLLPVTVGDGLKVMSIGFLLPSADDAVIWRGPLKMRAIQQFLRDVEWGELDYLVVDSPPGTGDEPLSICQLIEDADGAIVVTTPQDLAVSDVRKCVSFCRQLHLPVLGVIENMSGFVCPHCGGRTDLFKTGGGERLAADMGVPFLGRVPVDPQVVTSSDEGRPFAYFANEGATAAAFGQIVDRLADVTAGRPAPDSTNDEEAGVMKIALPTAEGKLCLHFGHAQQFAIVTVTDDRIEGTDFVEPPPHEPGALPRWLREQGVGVVIAGGMGRRAQGFFEEFGIHVIVGAASDEPSAIVRAYLDGSLETGGNVCDH